MQEIRQEHFKFNVLLLSIFIVFFTVGCVEKDNDSQGDTSSMTNRLEQQLNQQDGEAIDTAAQLGVQAIPVLMTLVNHKDPGMRRLVLESFAAAGGTQANDALAHGLADDSVNVRNSAVKLIHGLNTPINSPKFKMLLSGSSDAWVRGNVALFIGKANDKSIMNDIEKQYAVETDSQARQAMELALARLGHDEFTKKILQPFQTPQGNNDFKGARVLYDAIQELEYLGNPKHGRYLATLLSNKTQVKNIGTEPFPVWHRLCDRAVEAIPGVTGKSLPFDLGGRTYTDQEIQQAMQML